MFLSWYNLQKPNKVTLKGSLYINYKILTNWLMRHNYFFKVTSNSNIFICSKYMVIAELYVAYTRTNETMVQLAKTEISGRD